MLFHISEINKSSYYKWLSTADKRILREQQDNEIIQAIKALYEKHKGRYGIIRMTEALIIEKDIYCNHKKVYRLILPDARTKSYFLILYITRFHNIVNSTFFHIFFYYKTYFLKP